MAISTSAIINLATSNLKRNLPGIPDEVGNNSADPEGIFTDETLLVFPPNDIITLVWREYGVAELGVRRPYIQEAACPTNIWWSLSILPARFPRGLSPPMCLPHLALCTTSGKMMKAWGALPAKSTKPLQLSITERSKAASHGEQTVPTTWEFQVLELTHRTWASADYVPASFRSGSSDQTMVEWKQKIPVHKPKVLSKRKLDREAKSSASNYGDDDDSALGTDSHISGVDDPDEFAKASAARGDYKLDRKRRKEIKLWAKGTSGADPDAALLTDAQVEQYLTEQPRVVISLDLDKPDYLSRCKGRKA
ncbi:hypothetical protein DFH06DRAFT_1469919 [Mycena polygramma]|nr:hypothetical protein DFH06DRAFT_1469919 [Mycena polygramma]